MESPIIYNLFPRLVGSVDQWPAHAERAAQMGFNWVMLNPFHPPGFSGSIYAIKDFFAVDPLLVPDGTDPLAALAQCIDAMHQAGLKVMFDLVVNHTAKDSPLVKQHPKWFRRNQRGFVVSPYAVDPANPDHVTVWRDLAEVDNMHSPEREALWAYWTRLVESYVTLGCDGFRCDAAYKVPAELWSHLISAARKARPDTFFSAETLGCRGDEIHALSQAGFDYLYNSSKWWHFDQSWCLDQHEEFGRIGPSIAFPESHDTKRLFHETKGNIGVQKQRYAFAAAFSAGVMMPIGYEYCFRRKLHVVRTRPEHWEQTGEDLSPFIERVNRVKAKHPLFAVEGHWSVVTDLDSPTTILSKQQRDQAIALVINKDWHSAQHADLGAARAHLPGDLQLLRVCEGHAVDPEAVPDAITLAPGEVVYLL